MPFIPHTETDVADMLARVGVSKISDLFDEIPPDLQQRISDEILTTVDQDLLIWRNQAYVDRPLLAKQDVIAFTALRKWQKGFYDLPPLAADQD